MAESLEAFLERALRTVEESGKSTRAIRLTVAETGETFERWDSPLTKEAGGPGPAKLAEDIEDLIRSYAESFPAKSQVQMAIIAEDGEGSAKSRHIRTVRGTNQEAKRSILGGDTSLAEGARIHVETTRSLLNTMVANYNLLGQQVKAQMDTNAALMSLLLSERLEHAETRGDAEMNPVMAQLLAKLTEQIPHLGAALQLGVAMAADSRKEKVKAALSVVKGSESNGSI